MVYKDSVEEQSFLVSLQKEKLAFDKLMEEKSTMADENRFRNREAAGEDLYGSFGSERFVVFVRFHKRCRKYQKCFFRMLLCHKGNYKKILDSCFLRTSDVHFYMLPKPFSTQNKSRNLTQSFKRLFFLWSTKLQMLPDRIIIL